MDMFPHACPNPNEYMLAKVVPRLLKTYAPEIYRQGFYSLRKRRLKDIGYRNPHDKPKTVWRPSQDYNGNPYTDKTASS